MFDGSATEVVKVQLNLVMAAVNFLRGPSSSIPTFPTFQQIILIRSDFEVILRKYFGSGISGSQGDPFQHNQSPDLLNPNPHVSGQNCFQPPSAPCQSLWGRAACRSRSCGTPPCTSQDPIFSEAGSDWAPWHCHCHCQRQKIFHVAAPDIQKSSGWKVSKYLWSMDIILYSTVRSGLSGHILSCLVWTPVELSGQKGSSQLRKVSLPAVGSLQKQLCLCLDKPACAVFAVCLCCVGKCRKVAKWFFVHFNAILDPFHPFLGHKKAY